MRSLPNTFLTGLSIVSLLYSIGGVCQDTRWLIGFSVLALLLIGGGTLMLCKEWTKKSVSWAVLIAGFLIAGTLIYNYIVQELNATRNELWRDTLRSNKNDGLAMTDLEKSAVIDNDDLAQYTLARNLVYGDNGYDFDFAKAKDFAQKSADQGNPKAHALLAVIYSKGYGIKPDYQQAFSNIRQSIKDGYEQGLSLLPLLDSASFKLSPKDSIDIYECVQNGAYLDSIYDAVSTAFKEKGMQACYPIIRANKDRCQRLSDLDYYRATDLLYFEAFGDPTRQQELHEYAKKLAEHGRIPDLPAMRSFFFQALDGIKELSDETELVERAIANQDFWYSIMWDGYDKRYIKDLTNRYEYNLAFFERSKYLLANQDNLNSLFFELDEDLNQIYATAKNSLSDCTMELKEQMQDRPYLFAN